jgi:topoisomerase IV subunit A
LRKLEEMELRSERDSLSEELENIKAFLADEALQHKAMSTELRQIKQRFGQVVHPRLTRVLHDLPDQDVLLDDLVEKEPVTVICSQMGWIRIMKGHIALDDDIKYRDGDAERFVFHAQSTDKLLLLASNGRFYTLSVDKLPGGRSMGEPVRLMLDMTNEDTMIDLFVYKPKERLVLASQAGYGFIVNEDEVVAQTRAGKQVINVKSPDAATVCYRIGETDDSVAVVGDNRKLLIFALNELPEMARGKGVRLQAYKDGGLSDVRTFNREEGLKWQDPAGRVRVETDLLPYLGKRATAGRFVPRGFPKETKFT